MWGWATYKKHFYNNFEKFPKKTSHNVEKLSKQGLQKCGERKKVHDKTVIYNHFFKFIILYKFAIFMISAFFKVEFASVAVQ